MYLLLVSIEPIFNLDVKVHPVPSFDNLTALDMVLDKMQEAGLYLMYDMRGYAQFL